MTTPGCVDAPGVNFKETIMEKLKLLHPIKINGKEVKELTYDAKMVSLKFTPGASTHPGVVIFFLITGALRFRRSSPFR